jgi:hypothetical protein
MASRSSDAPDLFFLARGLSLASLVLVALYLSILAGSLFPLQLRNSAWQLKLGSALINASPLPPNRPGGDASGPRAGSR